MQIDLIQIYHNKAKIEGNSTSIAKICNAFVGDLRVKMRAHGFLEVPLSNIINIDCLGYTEQAQQ